MNLLLPTSSVQLCATITTPSPTPALSSSWSQTLEGLRALQSLLNQAPHPTPAATGQPDMLVIVSWWKLSP